MHNESINKTFANIFGILGIIFLIGIFFWIGDAYTYLDNHYWHIAQREPSVFDIYFWPLSWMAALILSAIPLMVCGIVVAHFHDLEVKKDEQERERLCNAKKAANLFINTNVSAQRRYVVDSEKGAEMSTKRSKIIDMILLIIFSVIFFLFGCAAIYVGYEGFSVIQQNTSTGVMKIIGAVAMLYVVKVMFEIFFFPAYTEIKISGLESLGEKHD